MAEPFSYSVWLVPAHPVREALARVIGELAQRFETRAFTPHATLCSGEWNANLDDLKRKLEPLSATLRTVELTTHGPGCGDERTTFFYIRLDNEPVEPLFAQAVAALPGSHAPKIGAHLSLMYAEPNAGIDREALATEIADRIPARIDFDEAQLV